MSDLDLSQAPNNSSAYVISNQADGEIDNAVNAYKTIAMLDADYALTANDQQRNRYLKFTGTLTAVRNITFLAGKSRRITIENATSGGFDIIATYSGSANKVTVPAGENRDVQGDGTDVFEVSGGGSGGGGGGSIAINSGSWVVLERKTASSSASLDFFFGLGLYDAVRARVNGVIAQNLGDVFTARLSTNGSTFDSGSNYQTETRVFPSSGAIDSYQSTAETGFVIAGDTGTLGVGNGANQTVAGLLTVYGPDTSDYKGATSLFSFINEAGNSTASYGGHHYIPTTTLQGIQFRFNTGNIVSGEIILEVLPKSPIAAFASAQTTDATVTVIWSLPLAAGEGASVQAQVQAVKSTGDEAYTITIKNMGLNIAGTTTEQTGGEQAIAAGQAVGSPGAVVAKLIVNNTTDAIELEVTGIAAETWDWVAVMTVTKL